MAARRDRAGTASSEPRASGTTTLTGRLVLEDACVTGRIEVAGERITSVTRTTPDDASTLVCPGFVDVHVHGWGGHDAMGGVDELDGMARALLSHGVTSFLPTAETASLDTLARYARSVRAWCSVDRPGRSEALGFNIEGPFISRDRRGAQNERYIEVPTAVTRDRIASLLDGLRIMTIAPELDGALDLIRWLTDAGVTVSLGHSDATAAEAELGFRAGARSTTHLFNAMSGVEHRRPGLVVAALLRDAAWVEMIADGVHLDPRLWSLILRCKPRDRVLLVSDAIALAGLPDGIMRLAGIDIELKDGRCTVLDDGRLAGSVIALDSAIRLAVAAGIPPEVAVGAATRAPLDLLGLTDRGRIAAGQLADLVVLDDALRVVRVMKRGRWQPVTDQAYPSPAASGHSLAPT